MSPNLLTNPLNDWNDFLLQRKLQWLTKQLYEVNCLIKQLNPHNIMQTFPFYQIKNYYTFPIVETTKDN